MHAAPHVEYRNVTSTTWPRYSLREIRRPRWSVRVKSGAIVPAGSGAPSNSDSWPVFALVLLALALALALAPAPALAEPCDEDGEGWSRPGESDTITATVSATIASASTAGHSRLGMAVRVREGSCRQAGRARTQRGGASHVTQKKCCLTIVIRRTPRTDDAGPERAGQRTGLQSPAPWRYTF